MSYNYDDFNGEALIYKYNIDENGNPVSIAIEEQKTVSTHGTIQLEQVPDELNRIVMLNENGSQMFEVFNKDEIKENSYFIDYSNGVAYFNKDNFEKVKAYNYYGKGLQLIGCSRIYDEHDVRGQHVMLTLQEIIDAGKEAIRFLLDIGDAKKVIELLESKISEGKITIKGLETAIQNGSNKITEINDTVVKATEDIDNKIAEVEAELDKVDNITGNDIKYITKSQWVLNSTSGMYEYTLPHTMNSKALTINCYYTDTDEFAFIGGKIIDKNNILFKNEEAVNLTVVLNSRYYKPQVTLTSEIAEEVVEARKGKVDLKTKIDEVDNELVKVNEELDNKTNKNTKIIRLTEIGCDESNSAEINRNKLVNEITKYEDYSLFILVDENHTFSFGELNINRSNVVIYGNGTFKNTKLKLVNDITQQKITIDSLTFYFDTLEDDNNAITMQKLIRSEIKNCKFYNCDKTIMYTDLDEPQHVSRIKITNNYFHNINFAIYGTRSSTGEQPLIVADIHVVNNIIEYCLNTHIWVEGFDGGVISDNTMFFPSYMLNPKCMTKQYNIYIDYCNWTIIKGNNMFESGKDSILLNHAQCVNINGNNIAWCGQISPSYAITFINGDNGKENGIYNMSTVSGNIVSKPSGGSLYIDEKCGYINASGNVFQGSGNREYYYGVEHSPSNNTIYCRGKRCSVGNNITDGEIDCVTSLENKSAYSNNIEVKKTNRESFNNVTYSGISMSELDANNVDSFVLNLTGSTITNIDGGYDGKELILHFYSSYVTINSENILIKERTSKTFESNTTLILKYFNGKWHEIGRDF